VDFGTAIARIHTMGQAPAFDALAEQFFREGEEMEASVPDTATDPTGSAIVPLRPARWKIAVVAGSACALTIIGLLIPGDRERAADGATREAESIAALAAAPVADTPASTPVAAAEPARIEPPQPVAAPAPVATPVATPVANTEPSKPKHVKPDPARAKRKYREGVAAFKRGDIPGARRGFRAAVAADRSFAPAHRGLGLVYRRLGKPKKAARSFRTYVRLAPRANDADKIRFLIKRLS
jgi:tetratricopeptide (TPR) repeat protein